MLEALGYARQAVLHQPSPQNDGHSRDSFHRFFEPSGESTLYLSLNASDPIFASGESK
jgi:hypothetical protein